MTKRAEYKTELLPFIEEARSALTGLMRTAEDRKEAEARLMDHGATVEAIQETVATPGGRIWLCRTIAGLSQADVAEAVGISRPALAQWENALSNPGNAGRVKLLAKVVDTDPAYLTYGDTPPDQEPPTRPRTPEVREIEIILPPIRVKLYS